MFPFFSGSRFRSRIRTKIARWVACAAAAVFGPFAHDSAVAQFLLPAHAFEGNAFPEQFGWQVQPPGAAEGERSVQDGWFIQTVRDDGQGTTGERNFYRKELDWFVGVDAFFVEWRAVTDNPAWVIEQGQVPTVVAAAGKAASWYHTTFADSAVALFRDPRFGTLLVPVSTGEPHIYRVEVLPDEYIWYVDGIVVDSGIPEGPYPDPNAFLIWGAGREHVDATTAWDYVRAGRIPDDGTCDFDSNGYQDSIDWYFVHDCLSKDGPGILSGPGNNAGPGCRFADFSGDGSVDLRDFAEFQILFTEVPCEPFCPGP